MGASRGQTNSKNAVIEIFELLWEETDEYHGLTESEIQRRLEQRHLDKGDGAPAPSTRTIYNQTHWLSIQKHPILGRRVSRVDIEDALRHTPDAKPGWYMEPFLSGAETRLLADSLMLSRIDREALSDLIGKLDALTGSGRSGNSVSYEANISSNEHVSTTFLSTVAVLDCAMRDGNCVEFQYQLYGVDRKRILQTNDDGNAKVYRLDPYGIVAKRGEYYLIGWFHDRPVPTKDESDDYHTNLYCFVIDRIVDIRELDEPIAVPMDTWDVEGVPMAISRTKIPFTPAGFAKSRPHMTMGPMIDATLMVQNDNLNVLYEWFEIAEAKELPPERWPDGRTTYLVKIRAPEMGLLFWILQYQSWFPIIVLEPADLRERLAQIGKQIWREHARPVRTQPAAGAECEHTAA